MGGSHMIRRHFNFAANWWFRNGIRGAVANLIISGSCLSCAIWVAASASLSSKTVSAVPELILVYAVPIFLIGFAAGVLSYQHSFGIVMTVVAALLGSFLGVLAGGIIISAIDTNNLIYPHGEYPSLGYAGWLILTTTLGGILAAIGVIVLAGSIRKIVKRTG
jgi:hypothetical protein